MTENEYHTAEVEAIRRMHADIQEFKDEAAKGMVKFNEQMRRRNKIVRWAWPAVAVAGGLVGWTIWHLIKIGETRFAIMLTVSYLFLMFWQWYNPWLNKRIDDKVEREYGSSAQCDN